MKAKFLCIVLLLGLSTVLVAQTTEKVSKKQLHPQEKMMKMKEGQRNPMLVLNLSQDQKEAFKRNMIEIHKQIMPLRNMIGEAEAHQRTLVTAEKPDLAAINKNIEKSSSLRAEIAKIMIKQRLEMRAQLTEEQRMKFDMQKMNSEQKEKGMRHSKQKVTPKTAN